MFSVNENEIHNLNKEQLHELIILLKNRCDFYESRMLTKPEVAERAGMTVSWLDNSYCAKAQRLRDIGVRYGISRTSPVRYPLHKVIAICHESEY